ncbi:Folate-sensitive fragile site protein Fra10Ac1 [Ceratobasidium sp. AG-Ba]|nr:Folate-sensitive fragile site protein Fra10Ac1 [Ceratobasidium sp. AG-Ba]
MPPASTSQSDFARSVFRNNLRGEDAYSRHIRYVTQFQNIYGGGSKPAVKSGKSELDGLIEQHKFLRDDDDKELEELSTDERIAVKYYRGLFKEFGLIDLKHYKSGKFALRWRTEDEVVEGYGQFTCGNTRCAYHKEQERRQPTLLTLELPFAYEEQGEAKQALVKVVLCERCKKKLMWKREKEKEEDTVEDVNGKQEMTRQDRDRRERERKDEKSRRRSRSPRRR